MQILPLDAIPGLRWHICLCFFCAFVLQTQLLSKLLPLLLQASSSLPWSRQEPWGEAEPT